MSNLSSAPLREETPHISDALKRRAQSIINNKSIDAPTRSIIRYGLEINDPCFLISYATRMRAKASSTTCTFIPAKKDRSINRPDLSRRRRT